jgi:excinuclease ABC subunit A
LIAPEKTRTLSEGAIKPWMSSDYRPWLRRLEQTGAVRFKTPYCELTPAEREFIWRGEGDFTGLRGFFAELERKKIQAACPHEAG